ncbi:MAG: hypothetical protein KY448_02790 [Cyanobacteria bacterium 0813]|nr:hypothetical protein [Cyanobacteria bacterium 0813]
MTSYDLNPTVRLITAVSKIYDDRYFDRSNDHLSETPINSNLRSPHSLSITVRGRSTSHKFI